MKRKNIIKFIGLMNIIIILIIYKLVINNNNIIEGKQVIKEMSESTQVTDLNNQINALNDNHTEYLNYIQNCKAQIATALTNQKVPTLEDTTLEIMAENIEKILEARTSDATVTAEDITDGKIAYANGIKIIGTKRDNISVGNIIYLHSAHNSTTSILEPTNNTEERTWKLIKNNGLFTLNDEEKKIIINEDKTIYVTGLVNTYSTTPYFEIAKNGTIVYSSSGVINTSIDCNKGDYLQIYTRNKTAMWMYLGVTISD